MFWLTALLLSSTSVADPPPGRAVPLPFLRADVCASAAAPSARGTLSNGLQALSVASQGAGTVAVSAFVSTSARAEAPGQAGLRYFVARALVECSAADQPLLADRIQELGADVISGATLDLTQITVAAAAEDVGPAAELLRDILFRPQFSGASLGRLRGQLLTELAASGRLPDIAAERAAADRLYPGHPFGRPVEGLAATVSAFGVEQVESLYAGSCIPNNVRIVVVGGVDPQVSLEAVRAAFGALLPGTRLPEAAEAPRPSRGGSEDLTRPVGTGFVHIGARAPGLCDPAYPATTVALAVLGSGMGSRLYAALRQSDGIAYSFSAEARAAREGARTGVLAACPPDQLDEAETRLLMALRRMATETVSAEEILRAKEYIVTGHAMMHQRSVDLAHQLGALEVASGRGLELDRELPQLVRDVTPEQVRDAARAMFETRVRVRVLPS